MIGILLTNTGTPDAPTTQAVRRYLREFLSDRRIVHLPRIIWLPILYGIILPFRAPKSAALYKSIWVSQGSPMRVHMEDLRSSLEKSLNDTANQYCVELGMNYGNPPIAAGLNKLHERGAKRIIALPLFPQYSDTSTGSSFDRIEAKIERVHHYYDHPAYISALAKSVNEHWQQKGKSEHLLISFHGIPERFAAEGDPYPQHCEKTANALAEALQLTNSQWTLCYQSQFGYDKWLKPSTQALFTELPARGIKTLDIICPGFAVDCLETLEEIAIRGEESFIESGGKSLHYIPALNSNVVHTTSLKEIISDAMKA